MDEQFVGVANQSFTMEQGKTKLLNVIKEFDGSISAWTPIGTGWDYCDLTVDSDRLRVGVSAGGVVSVNGDPFTPNKYGRAMNVTNDAIRTSCMSALRLLDEENEPVYSGSPTQ
ncbi:MAG: hypothetical protein Q7K26_01265 [bacterium]|nr:hypothetical protein [bacterium]